MKKLISLSLGLLVLGTISSQALDTDTFYGAAASSVSNNGKWMVCETEQEFSLKIINLEDGKSWDYISSGMEGATQYTIAFTRAVSDNGIVIGEVSDVPSYWENGKWYNLKGFTRTSTGYVFCAMGGITPDGSMIVGSLGRDRSASLDSEVDVLWTNPCVWYRQPDGSYGNPVWLPIIDKDIFGRTPQYLNCIAVSDDGKTIGAMMRSGSGFFHFPIVYTLSDSGEWEMQVLGMSLINPRNVKINPYPGDYYGPGMPNYEDYLTDAARNEFYYGSKTQQWLDDLVRQGYTEEQIAIEEHIFVMEFMTPEQKEAYEPLLQDFLDQFLGWQEAWDKYEESMVDIMTTGMDFAFNNILISPDGKYIYSSGMQGLSSQYIPVRFEVGTEDYQAYRNNGNIIISSITEDYSVLGYDYYGGDADMFGTAYIFPQGDSSPVPFYDYYRDNKEIYDWMEESMYQSVVVGVTSTGAEQFDDRWSMGKPISNPSMSVIAFGTSSLYWEAPPTTSSYLLTFMLYNTDSTGIQNVGSANEEFKLSVLPDSSVALSKTVNEISIFDLSGKLLYKNSNVEGTLNTGLSSGVYVIKVTLPDGTETTRKAIF